MNKIARIFPELNKSLKTAGGGDLDHCARENANKNAYKGKSNIEFYTSFILLKIFPCKNNFITVIYFERLINNANCALLNSIEIFFNELSKMKNLKGANYA